MDCSPPWIVTHLESLLLLRAVMCLVGFISINLLVQKRPQVTACRWKMAEVEAIAGKKARKWRQTLLHLGKPSCAYDLSGCQTQEDQPMGGPDNTVSGNTLSSGQDPSVRDDVSVTPSHTVCDILSNTSLGATNTVSNTPIPC